MLRLWMFFLVTIVVAPIAFEERVLGQGTAAPGVVQTPPRDASGQTGTGRIRGRVAAADTGQPIRKAQVRATAPEVKENRVTTTDVNGVYELVDLPAGRYQLTVTKGSFVQLQYGQTRPFEPGKPLALADGQRIDKVDFSLPRGALITGRILDEFGDPMTDVQVSAMRYQFVQGRRQLAPVGRIVTTNDIGEYRLFGLAPGHYLVAATLRAANAVDAISSDRSGYAPTYYPGTSVIAEAERLNLELSQIRNSVDLVLVPARLARITGTAVDSDGKPLPGGLVGIFQSAQGGFAGLSIGQIRADGGFTLSNVAPGEYTLRAVVPNTALAAGASPELIATHLTVAGQDITGLRLSGVKSSSVSGKIVRPQAATGGSDASPIQLVLVPEVAIPLGPSGLVRVHDDSTFEVRVQPGRHFVRLGAQTKNMMLKAVTLNGADVTDSGLEFRPSEDVSGLEVYVTSPSEVSGTVTNSRSQIVKDYSVVVFARDAQRWVNASRYFGESRSDQDGRYTTRNLPPGQYYAIALDYVEPGSATDPEFLGRVRAQATEFSLGESETKTLDLKLVNAQ